MKLLSGQLNNIVTIIVTLKSLIKHLLSTGVLIIVTILHTPSYEIDVTTTTNPRNPDKEKETFSKARQLAQDSTREHGRQGMN